MQPWQHIHILGAPGSGVTTLGKALAERLGFTHFDTDDYYWFTNDALPYRRKRNPEHRRTLLQNDLSQTDKWVLSGALCGWGDALIPDFDLVVYVWLPAETRLDRIRQREKSRYGAAKIAPGGDLHVVFEKFLLWAATYDTADGNIRSRASELHWLSALPCPAIKIEQDVSIPQALSIILGNMP